MLYLDQVRTTYESCDMQTEGKGGELKGTSRAPGACSTWEGPQAHMALMVQNTLKEMQQSQSSIKEDEEEQVLLLPQLLLQQPHVEQ